MRTWPKAGCPMASATMTSSIPCGTRFFQNRLLAADLLQRQLAAFVVEFLEPVEAVAAVAHHLAGLADVAKLLGKLQQPNLGTDNLLLGGHGVLQCAEAGRFATPTTPRPASARDSPWGPGHLCQIKFWLMHIKVQNDLPRSSLMRLQEQID